jgi:Icc-related predicted phosphoesterase
MKIILISDTHGLHDQLQLPEGDMLIHAGDVSMRGDEHEILAFLDWFGGLNYKYKIFISGNHDFFFERKTPAYIKSLIPENVIYLNDSHVMIEGIKIWGSPIQPWFHDWAFNRKRGEEIQKHWDLIPDDADIVVTHGPVFGILDTLNTGVPVGCEDLLPVIQRIKPKIHLCGHIHEAYGMVERDGTIYINASVLNLRYQMANQPVVLDIY